ncbi:E3 ubiquitin-protein ligase RNF180 isoform X2 [Pristis pectinata]|uniref:E3 ubiquitin-protein ligase RNF180 isoform X2 n=1 Tax=Pristis pectinata TaxID=685728 RepID=UPI00223E5994|nr:E3 ubiquitin-protein ligase RNF180 isoform X2 [Pristis pectinata]XP_051866048.1 E3 ubiquitin-protein ligase RNF180 isoform X2 [Pristis pectinata]
MEGILRCWKCRRFVLDVGSLSLSQRTEPSKIQDSAEEPAGQINCTVWHVKLEAVPEWIRKEIEKSWWTIGKLNCQHCGARLGDFNFVCPAKCPCGQTVTVHICKSRTDYEPPHLIRISESAEVKSLRKLQYMHMVETVKKMEHGIENSLFCYRHKEFLHHSKKMDRERMTDALCLEARSHSRGIVEVDSNEFNFKAAYPQPCSSASQPVRARCAVKGFHKKSFSLDFNSTSSKDASVSFSTIHGLCPRSSSCGLIMNHIDEASGPIQQIPLAEDTNLQLPAREELNGSLFHNQCIKESDFALSPQSYHNHPVEEERIEPGPSVPRHCRSKAAHVSPIVRGWSPDSSTETSDAEEWEEGHEAGTSNPRDDSAPCIPLLSTVGDRPLSKRQRNKLKSLKRKQRKWQRWHQCKLKEQKQASSSNLTTSDDDEIKWEKEGYICAVCLDIFFSPYMCYPCHHIFCEPCLRTLAKDNPTSTPCPLCRTIITRVFFQTELNNTMKSLFSEEYLARRQSFQKASCAKWPLPSCRRLIKVLGGFGRRPDPVARRQFPHGAYRLDFEDDNRGWRFDMDMVIIYIYSVNWVIGFIIFCFLCYFFFPSF